jgi:hypothetical protein
VAYNKAIATDAKRSFPASVTCATAHSLAFRAVGRRFAHRLNGPRMPARQTAKELGITRPLAIPHVGLLAPQQAARLVMETITRFCHSDAAEVEPWHVPKDPRPGRPLNDRGPQQGAGPAGPPGLGRLFEP